MKNNSTKKRRSVFSKTSKNKHHKANIIQTFLTILNELRLYHWKTKSYAEHKATDELLEKLTKDVDTFVEVMLGKSKKRVDMVTHTMKLYDLDKKTDVVSTMFEFREFLMDLERVFDKKKDTDLFSIRDDMLIHVNQFLYLLKLDR